MNVVDKLFIRHKQYEELFGRAPSVIMLSQEEKEELFNISPSIYDLMSDLSQIGLKIEVITPDEITHLLEILTKEQLALLLIHEDDKTRKLAELELKKRKAKSF